MSDEREKSAALSIAGVVQVSPLASGKNAVRVGPSAGWLTPVGISSWESELSFIPRAEMTAALARAVRATLPGEQIAAKRYPLASYAVETVPFLALNANIVADVRNQGVRVHTVGVDRVSAGFYYFAEGGAGAAVQVQGNLVEMLTPSLAASSTNADIAALLKDLIDRLLVHLSAGAVSELDVELASALPRLSRDATGLVGTDLDAFEAQARSLAEASARWEVAAHRLVEALATADASGRNTAKVPLYGEASKDMLPALDVHVGGRTLTLEPTPRWTVRGAPREEPVIRAHVPSAAVTQPSSAASVASEARPPVAAQPKEPAIALQPAAAASRTDRQAGAPTAPGQPDVAPSPVAGFQSKVDKAPATAEAPSKTDKMASPAAQAPSKADKAVPAAAEASGKTAAQPAPEPALTPLTPAPIVSIGAPTAKVDRAAVAPAPAPVEAAPITPAPAPVESAPIAPAPAPVESAPIPPAPAPAAQPAPVVSAPTTRAATPAAPTSPRSPTEVRPAAAAAPSTGRLSGLKVVIFLLIVVFGVWFGRFVRNHYLHWH